MALTEFTKDIAGMPFCFSAASGKTIKVAVNCADRSLKECIISPQILALPTEIFISDEAFFGAFCGYVNRIYEDICRNAGIVQPFQIDIGDTIIVKMKATYYCNEIIMHLVTAVPQEKTDDLPQEMKSPQEKTDDLPQEMKSPQENNDKLQIDIMCTRDGTPTIGMTKNSKEFHRMLIEFAKIMPNQPDEYKKLIKNAKNFSDVYKELVRLTGYRFTFYFFVLAMISRGYMITSESCFCIEHDDIERLSSDYIADISKDKIYGYFVFRKSASSELIPEDTSVGIQFVYGDIPHREAKHRVVINGVSIHSSDYPNVVVNYY